MTMNPQDTIEVGDLVGLTFSRPDGGTLPKVRNGIVLKEEQHFYSPKNGLVTGIVLNIFNVAHEYGIGLKHKGYHYTMGFHILVGEPLPIVVYWEESWHNLASIAIIAKANGMIVNDPTEPPT